MQNLFSAIEDANRPLCHLHGATDQPLSQTESMYNATAVLFNSTCDNQSPLLWWVWEIEYTESNYFILRQQHFIGRTTTRLVGRFRSGATTSNVCSTVRSSMSACRDRQGERCLFKWSRCTLSISKKSNNILVDDLHEAIETRFDDDGHRNYLKSGKCSLFYLMWRFSLIGILLLKISSS